jgi:hypothetical protein
MLHLVGSGTPVLYIGRTVFKVKTRAYATFVSPKFYPKKYIYDFSL